MLSKMVRRNMLYLEERFHRSDFDCGSGWDSWDYCHFAKCNRDSLRIRCVIPQAERNKAPMVRSQFSERLHLYTKLFSTFQHFLPYILLSTGNLTPNKTIISKHIKSARIQASGFTGLQASPCSRRPRGLEEDRHSDWIPTFKGRLFFLSRFARCSARALPGFPIYKHYIQLYGSNGF
jgi:hypothetical protein